jgi:hypothetical protein
VARKHETGLIVVRDIGRYGMHVISKNVLSVAYQHADSVDGKEYEHDFSGTGTQLLAHPRGHLVLYNPRRRLWEDRVVRANE